MTTPADWGAIPVESAGSPKDWGAIPVEHEHPADKYQIEPPGAWERAGYGAQKVLDRVSQLTMDVGEKLGLLHHGLADIATQQMNEQHAEFERHQGEEGPAVRYDQTAAVPMAGGDKYGRKSVDLAEVAGSAGMQSPLALLPGGMTIVGRAAAGGLQGGVSGLLQYDPTNKLSQGAKNVLTGTAAGAVVTPAIGAVTDKIGEVARSLAGKAKGLESQVSGDASEQEILRAVPELSQLDPEVRADLIHEAQKQIRQTGELSAEQMQRKANLLANGVTPTKSMVTRDAADWTRERNLQKLAQSPDAQLSDVGQQLTSVYNANDAALAGRLQSISPATATQEGHGMVVMKALDDLADATQAEVGKVYDQVRATRGADLASDAKNLATTLDDLKDNTYSEKLVSSVNNKLKRFGMLDKDGSLMSNTLTVDQAEELRKFVNKLPNDYGKKDIIRSIDADVLSGAGDDAFSAARQAAAARFGMLDNPATQKALNAYGELTQGKTAQNFIKSHVVDAPIQDVQTLVNTLSKIPDEGKRSEALAAMKSGVMSYLQSKSINPNSGQVSGAALNKAITEIGEDKLQLITGADYDKLRSLSRAALDATYQPPYSAVNNSNTAPMLLGLAQKARVIPGVPLLVTENAEKLAAQAGYRKQLSDALSAQTKGALPKLPASAKQIGEVLQKLGIPASQAVFDQLRNPPNKDSKKRNATGG